jgi:hypothetical protein
MLIRDLFEAVPLSLARPIMKAAGPRPYDDLFAANKKFVRKSPDRLYFPIIRENALGDVHFDVMERVYEQIRQFSPNNKGVFHDIGFDDIKPLCWNEECTLVLFGEDREERIAEMRAQYRRGVVTVLDREVRIGKVLNRIEAQYRRYVRDAAEIDSFLADPVHTMTQMLDQFLVVKRAYETDPTRDLTKKTEPYTVVISRHPYDIAGMSTGRGWTSCTSLTDGKERRYVARYAQGQSLIAYLIRDSDTNIEKPVARLNIVRYENENGDFILLPHELYGTKEDRFETFVRRWCRVVNRGKDDGLYCIPDDQQYARAKITKAGNEAIDQVDYDRYTGKPRRSK